MSGPIDLPNGKGKGKWQRILVDEYGDNPRWSAIIRCPDCGVHLPIINHTIANDGQVSPSVGHPVGSCSWHVSPKLIGWEPCPPAPPQRAFNECNRCHAKSRSLGGWGYTGNYSLICAACMKAVLGGAP